MNKIIIFTMLVIISATSCKKSLTEAPIPPGNPNNEMKAMASINGSTASSFTSTGNATVFSKRVDPNGDTVIVIVGGEDKGQIDITLVNINSAGTYLFKFQPTSRQYILCQYKLGNWSSLDLYFTSSTRNQAGTLIIESLTPNNIKGSFTANCTGQNGIVQITNGSFKGDF